MRLFGRDLSGKKKLPSGPNELVEQNYEIVKFFRQAMESAGIDLYLSTLILGTVSECIVTGSFCLNGVTKAMPITLCVLRKAGFRALGLIDPLIVGDLEAFLREVCGASAKTVEGLSCWNLTIERVDYPLFMMTGGQTMNVGRIPKEIMIVTDKPLEELTGIDGQTKVVRDFAF